MLELIQETAAYLKGRMHTQPETAIILGTGLGSLATEITEKYEIKYEEIPNFPVSTVEGHSGKLIFGKLGNKDIMAMQGRFHYYEGYSMKEVTFPVRVMRELDIKTLFVSNASGGTNPDFEIGDLMIITDHINYFPEHPLRGKNIPYGPRFPDMSEAYDKELIRKANAIAAEKGIKVQHGVYIGTQGPTFETPSEYKLFHILAYTSDTDCQSRKRRRGITSYDIHIVFLARQTDTGIQFFHIFYGEALGESQRQGCLSKWCERDRFNLCNR